MSENKERTLKIIRSHKMGSDKAWGKFEPEVKQVEFSKIS